jgi:hypothetical protein
MKKSSLMNSGGSHRHSNLPQYERSEADLYVTPHEAVTRLYRARPHLKETWVWDSSAGLGHIVKAVHDAGGKAVGTELHDHPFPKQWPIHIGVDLLQQREPHAPVCVINPPYNQADRHIRHMLGLGCDVWAILRFNFITAKSRAWMLGHLAEILMVGRTKMLPPGAIDRGMQPSIDYAWFLFTPEGNGGAGIRLERA